MLSRWMYNYIIKLSVEFFKKDFLKKLIHIFLKHQVRKGVRICQLKKLQKKLLLRKLL